MLKREMCAESNRKLPHLIIPGKTADLVPEFALEDLPLSKLQPWFLHCNEGPTLEQNSDDVTFSIFL